MDTGTLVYLDPQDKCWYVHGSMASYEQIVDMHTLAVTNSWEWLRTLNSRGIRTINIFVVIVTAIAVVIIVIIITLHWKLLLFPSNAT